MYKGLPRLLTPTKMLYKEVEFNLCIVLFRCRFLRSVEEVGSAAHGSGS